MSPEQSSQDRLRSLLLQKSILSAGKMQVLGLEGLKERFGESWPHVSGRVAELSKFIIEKKLGPSDIFIELEGIGYVLIFPELDRKEAEIKCLGISCEIATKLFGESDKDGKNVSVRTIVGEIDGSIAMESVNLGDAVSGLLEEVGDEFITDNEGSIQRNGSLHKADEIEVVDFSNYKAGFFDRLSFQYRPIWDTKREAIISYRCQSFLEADLSGGASDKSANLSRDDLLSLDILSLKNCCQHMMDLQKKKRKLILCCPLHFETVSIAKNWKELLKHCQPIPETIRKYFLFEIVGLEVGVPQFRIAQVVQQLKPFCREIVFLVGTEEKDMARFNTPGISALGVDLYEFRGSEKDLLVRLDEFEEACQKQYSQSYVSNVSSTSLATIALSSGFRYLDGDAIREPVKSPADAFAFDTHSLYGALYLNQNSGEK